MPQGTDISENILFQLYPDTLLKLLEDHASKANIYWATDSYSERGDGYQFFDPITIEKITGKNEHIIRPRALKSKTEQIGRTKDKAGVFSPSWVCNAQNNMVDDRWFGTPYIFNIQDTENNTWLPTTEKITFPTANGKSWKDYVCDTRLEIACGEAPYLASRYDVTTGLAIPLHCRIGILDRKLRVVNENAATADEWLLWAYAALKSTYGFEWQGDNLLLARETLLITFCDYFEAFAKEKNLDSKELSPSCLLHAAYIISWNLFQMDGLKMVLPLTCKDTVSKETLSFYEEPKEKVTPCPGCDKQNVHKHNGIKQIVADWQKDSWSIDERPISVVEFHSLMP